MRSGCIASLRTFCLVLAAGIPMGTVLWADDDLSYRPPVQLDQLWMIIPMEITHLLSHDDSAEAIVRIDETGQVIDWICLYTPHYKLLPGLGEALAGLTFEPATENGEPVVVDLNITVPVGEIGTYGILTLTPASYLESRIASISHAPDEMKVCKTSDLDRPLTIAQKGKPVVPVDENQNRISGEVEVRFYVDWEGVPRLIRSDMDLNPVLRNAAHLTVEQLRFLPPTWNGRPTAMKARMSVRF